MALNVISAIGYAWGALGALWIAGLPFTKPTLRSQPVGSRLFHLGLDLLGVTLLGSSWFVNGWLAARFVPSTHGVQLTGLALTIAGCLFAAWSRILLGGNWSGRATVKSGHELVLKGPYALVRHPIYTGIIAAILGTSLAIGEWRCLVGCVVILLKFIIKMSQEERFMAQTFPEEYSLYCDHVKALIPGLL